MQVRTVARSGAAKRKASSRSRTGGGRLVLVVEDDPAVRSVLRRSLRRSGYRVLEAADGLKAARLIRKRKPSAAILDLDLPGMSGISVLRRFRRKDKEAAAVVLTGDGRLETVRKAMRLGARAYITKPFEPAQLQGLLE